MKILEPQALAKEIHEFVSTEHPVLFSGSGLGKRVGMPLWNEFLDHLASVCEKHGDNLSSQLMKKYAAQGDYVRAAGVYELCGEIPNGERLKELAKPFSLNWDDAKLDLLKPVFELPFGAVVTTNYDRSQHDAFARARLRSAVQLELDDGTLRSGALHTNFFIARIHGRAEIPQSIVVFPSGYQRLDQDHTYKDFLLCLLNERPCLFLGFSFVDPAIRQVLTLYERQAGPAFKTLHRALLPNDSSTELRQLLMKLNIQTLYYDGEKAHRALWQALHLTQALASSQAGTALSPGITVPTSAEYSSIHRYLGFAYAQQRSAKQLRPLLEQVREGLITAIIRDAGTAGTLERAILNKVRNTLHLSQEEATFLVRDSLARLLADEAIQKKGDLYVSISPEPELLAKHLTNLATGIVNRMKVREGIALNTDSHAIICEALERIFVLRAWDLAAHYAGGGAGYGSDVNSVIQHAYKEAANSPLMPHLKPLERCTLDLLSAPSDRESDHLAEVGRTAFALQLVLSTPRQALLQRHALPQNVYFDASVLLPTLVPGHPLRPVYHDALMRLGQAAKEVGTRCELIVGFPFLNEVISHREIALRTVRDQRLDNPRLLRRLITFYGADNVNVFIGAFASHVAKAEGQGVRPPKFTQFLSQHAPYATELALAEHLKKIGVRIVTMDFRQKHNQEFSRILNPLTSAYEDRAHGGILEKKERVLVRHEAAQIVQLKLDRDAGSRSVFVSADRSLRRALLSAPELRHYANMVVPPQGFIGLVDIMVGLKADRRSLARLIWAAPRRDVDQAIRDYLIRHALDQQDAAVAKHMPEVISEMVAEAKRKLEKTNFDITNSRDSDDVARTARFMDRLDDEFMEVMKWWIEKEES